MSNDTQDYGPIAQGSDSEHNTEPGESSRMAQQSAARYRDMRYYFKIVVFQASFNQIRPDYTRI